MVCSFIRIVYNLWFSLYLRKIKVQYRFEICVFCGILFYGWFIVGIISFSEFEGANFKMNQYIAKVISDTRKNTPANLSFCRLWRRF